MIIVFFLYTKHYLYSIPTLLSLSLSFISSPTIRIIILVIELLYTLPVHDFRDCELIIHFKQDVYYIAHLFYNLHKWNSALHPPPTPPPHSFTFHALALHLLTVSITLQIHLPGPRPKTHPKMHSHRQPIKMFVLHHHFRLLLRRVSI